MPEHIHKKPVVCTNYHIWDMILVPIIIFGIYMHMCRSSLCIDRFNCIAELIAGILTDVIQ